MLKKAVFSLTCLLALTSAAFAGPTTDDVRKLAAEMQASALGFTPEDTTMPVNPPVALENLPVQVLEVPDTTMPVNPPVTLVEQPDVVLDGPGQFEYGGTIELEPDWIRCGTPVPGADEGGRAFNDGEIMDIGWVIPHDSINLAADEDFIMNGPETEGGLIYLP